MKKNYFIIITVITIILLTGCSLPTPDTREITKTIIIGSDHTHDLIDHSHDLILHNHPFIDHSHDLIPHTHPLIDHTHDFIEHSHSIEFSWFAVTQNQSYVIPHHLGTVPSIVVIKYKKLLTDKYEILTSIDWRTKDYSDYQNGSYYAFSNDSILIRTGINSIIPFSHINTTTGTPEEAYVKSGYFKVIIWK